MSATFPSPCIEWAPPLAHCRPMKTSWKTMFVAALGTVCVASAATARENPSTGDPTLTVLVHDYAGLADNSLDEMETLTAGLLSRAGVRMQWVHCRGHQAGPRPALCDANLEKGLVMLRILVSFDGKSPLGDPLGMAEVDSGYASLYASEINKYASHNGLSASNLMAYAATHEIGHLLLGRSHSSSGIMRAVWGKAEYREMGQRWLGFSAEQRQALRQAVPATEQLLATSK